MSGKVAHLARARSRRQKFKTPPARTGVSPSVLFYMECVL